MENAEASLHGLADRDPVTDKDLSAGLDASRVAATLPSIKSLVNKTQETIGQHYEAHQGYVSWSGGRDSTAVVAIARLVKPDIPIVWFDSGLEYPETRTYIAELADAFNLNLHVIEAQPTALEVLQETGAWTHESFFNDKDELHSALITAPARAAHSIFGRGEVTGLRAEESQGRRIFLAKKNGTYTRADHSVVCAPLWRQRTVQIQGILSYLGVRENPVYAKLSALGAPLRAQRVGLVVDGNNPEHGRYTYLRTGWPDLWTDLVQVLPRLNEWR